MASLLSETTFPLPLTLREQLGAMLAGWLDRHAPDGDLGSPEERAAGVVTVADRDLPQVEEFCADWGMTVRRTARGDGRWAVLVVEGQPLPVRGFIEITALYRR
jgi:hypothetical protein